jgi:hypothetical protein
LAKHSGQQCLIPSYVVLRKLRIYNGVVGHTICVCYVSFESKLYAFEMNYKWSVLNVVDQLKCIFQPRLLDNNLAQVHAFAMDGIMLCSGLIASTQISSFPCFSNSVFKSSSVRFFEPEMGNRGPKPN